MLNIFLTNLGLYNEGVLSGEWVSLPVSDFDLEAVKIRIGVDEYHEETFITDYETDIPGLYDCLGEYESIDELNYLAELLETVDETTEAPCPFAVRSIIYKVWIEVYEWISGAVGIATEL